MNELSNKEILDKRHSTDKNERIRAHVECIKRATEEPGSENDLMGRFLGYNTILS